MVRARTEDRGQQSPAEHVGDRGQQSPARYVYESVFRLLDEAETRWCVLRAPANLERVSGDLDLLVHPDDLIQVRDTLESLLFVLSPAWDRVSDRFFVRRNADRWITLHVVTELSFGRFHTLQTNAAGGCLARRAYQGAMAVPAEDDVFWLLLLHCLVDKGRISERYQAPLHRLASEALTGSPLARIVSDCCPPGWDAGKVLAYARAGEWITLASLGRGFGARWQRKHAVAAGRKVVSEVVRRLGAKALVPVRRRGLCVALLGPDGAGKSTLAAGIQHTFALPVHTIHMGLSDDQVPWFARLRLPKVGAPGRLLVTAGRYVRGQYYKSRGELTIFDRYTYDVLLPSPQAYSPLKTALRRLLAWMFPAPDLVLLLDVPGHVAFGRKGEYDAAHMEVHRQHLLALQAHLPHIRTVNATRTKDEVRAHATDLIWQEYVRRWTGR